MNAQNEEPVVPMNPSDETMVSRRKLLKALAATSGAVVASQMLPGQWMKPVIESGVLPAHAVGSPTRTPTSTPQPGITPTNTPQPGITPTATPAANITGRWIIEFTITALGSEGSTVYKVGSKITTNWAMTQTGGQIIGEWTKTSGWCGMNGTGIMRGNDFSLDMLASTGSCCGGLQGKLVATMQGSTSFTGTWNALDYPRIPDCERFNATIVGRIV
jgi:hypothetical protein